MHDRNGFDVLEDLKSDDATKDIPVVLHTSYNLTQDDLSRLRGATPRCCRNKRATMNRQWR